MRVLVMIFTLVCFCHFYSTAQTIDPAPADKAVVYFVRPSSLGFAINFSYFDSTRLIGKFNGPAYIRYTCDPGQHLFWARSENRDFVEAELEAGKIYFIEAIVNMGAMKAAVNLEPVDPNDEKRMNRILKLMGKRSSESFSEAELKEQETKMKDVIDRGLAKYAEEKQKGKIKPGLAKSMSYNID